MTKTVLNDQQRQAWALSINGFSLLKLFLITILASSCNTLSKQDIHGQMSPEKLEFSATINPRGNTWVVNNLAENQTMITKEGVQNWKNIDNELRTYFKTNAIGNLHLGLHIKVPEGISKIKVSVGDQSKEITVSNRGFENIPVGVFTIGKTGYHYIQLEGIEKTGATVADIKEVLVGGPAVNGAITHVKEDFYWGRRGPSVHLSYITPEDTDILWFYNEITVPENEDVIGSYYMANGFGQGYFGMQVNTETERRVLFSVWSPFETQDPNEIPDDQKIILLGKGKGVTTGEFGNEGSGGQSYKVFDWKAGNTYKFLLKGEPSENNSTDFTAYFYDPEIKEWNLIASFRRPHTSTYLTRPHSFLENFETEMGFVSRQAEYTNQWVFDTKGNWHELTQAKFTADATARKGSREDYAGGAYGNTFYMRNCGFFSDKTDMDTFHRRKSNGVAPNIDFSALEVPNKNTVK
ncbi:protein of unknown function [Arenibacter nanhaiticus]|uniref:DUF5077 domain-containing protein n=1 Tax=Arenibacter nanhaiticus TaxID=558155 RepID=A0A1M6E3A3_9FLAO|nr:DUF3472 domain-containing protein [Arenibacter nanhaiticus]SHI79885.1 protein of unknown function [Arenibacter nanhaiticus]